jgi:hypothetical protein
MATKAELIEISLIAGADLSAQQFRGVKVNASSQIVLAGASDITQVGVLQDKPISGVAGCVAIFGRSKIVAGATIASGVEWTTDANGAAIAATTGKLVCGTVIAGGASGDIISVLINPRGLKA